MTSKRSRVFALSGAVLFLITASSLTIVVIVALIQSSHSSTPATSSNNSTTNSPTTTGKLQGTPLANFTPNGNITRLTYQDEVVGTGAVAKANSNVTVNYTGAVAATGIIFQSSKDTGKPVTFSLNQVILGWRLGVPGMKVGGTRRLFIPAAMAYGANPPTGSGIPANAALVFDISLLKVN